MKKDMNHQYSHHNPIPSIQISNKLSNKSNTAPILIKNVRSSSLPLKIINNTNSRLNSISNNNDRTASTHVRSWTDFSFLNKQRNNFDCFNLNGLYFKYRQISRSDRFLDFIEFKEPVDELNFNSNSSLSSSSSSPSMFCSTTDYSNSIKSKNNNNNNISHVKIEEENENISPSSSSPSSPPQFEPLSTVIVEQETTAKINELDLNMQTKISNETESCNFNCIKEEEEEDEEDKNEISLEDINSKTINESLNLIESTRLDECDLNEKKNIVVGVALNVETSHTTNDVKKEETEDEKNETLISSSFLLENEQEEQEQGEKNIEDELDELSYKDFIPKKSCLKSKIFINELSNSDYSSSCTSNSSGLSNSDTNATSSPLMSPSYTNSSSSGISLFSNNNNESACNNSTTLSSSSSSSSKKRVFFADDAGQELFTVRTMSEPSNCPPKLTSKVVQYFLNREFNSNQNDTQFKDFDCYSNNTSSSSLSSSSSSSHNNQFFSTTRSYDYGISALNYSNDVNKLSGSLAVYSLNFQQPAGDYLKFRQRIEHKCVSLENVLLNGFQVNGTIKVKNINFHKNVFIRFSFNKWQTFEDFQAIYVHNDYFSSNSSPSMSSSSISASFCGANNSNYYPVHKENDTFRFEIQLPRTVDENKLLNNEKKHATASIQFCICYRTGTGDETREYWDNNDGLNYEILQYLIDLERLKPNQHASTAAAAQLAKNNTNKQKLNYYKSAQESGVYY